jgi:cell division protein FtsQ
LVGVVAVLSILGSPLFSIAEDDVVVTGAVYTDRIRLEEIIGEAVGSTTLLLNTSGIETQIEEIAWVDTARVRTSFPRGLRIEIRERSPLATYQGSDGLFRVIDKEGRVLDAIQGQPIAYVLLFGLEDLVLQPGQFTPPGPVGAAQLVQALTATVRGRAQAIEVDPNGDDLRLYLHRDSIYEDLGSGGSVDGQDPEDDPLTAERIEVRFGAASELLVKLVRLETVLPVALTEEVSFIDVSTATVTVR